MLNRLTQKPLDEVMHTIQALDLESVKLRVMDPELGEGWSREYADNIEAAYKRYLVMQVKYSDDAEDILLAKDVDEFWHTHILQTRKYFDDCQSMFGNYLHHNPHVGDVTPQVSEERARAAEKTRRLYEAEFGGAEGAEVAWAGVNGAHAIAVTTDSEIRPNNAAFSASAIEAGNAAFSASAIEAGNAAFSASAIKAGNAAFSASAIKAGNAAFSASAIKAGNAAFSASAIKSGNAAFSASAIKAGNAAFSASAIKADNAAFSASAIKANNAAFSASAIKAVDTSTA